VHPWQDKDASIGRERKVCMRPGRRIRALVWKELRAPLEIVYVRLALMQPGQQITQTLRLARLLGQGGMGSVWAADHLTLGTQVAVKFMSPAYVQNDSLVQRFRTEAMAAAQIKSPHVAQVFDHGFMANGTPYIVMELLEGEDLKRRIRREGSLPLSDVALVVSQACKALSRAHALGIVHRDIKPDNIFLQNLDGETFVKLLDFGIAKLGPDGGLGATTTGSMMGTPLYMSPEQLLSAKRVDHRSDLWSLAVVAYHAITGRVPFHGETVGSLSVAVHTGTFQLPSALRPDVPQALDAWFMRMLQRDPAARFGSAKEMADALEQAVHGASAMRMPMASQPGSAAIPPNAGPMVVTPVSGYQSFPTPMPQSSTSSPSGPPQTLNGTSTTSARMASGRSMTRIAALVGLLLLGVSAVALVLALRSPDAPPEDTAAAAPAEPPKTAEPAPAPTPEPEVLPVVPTSTASASAKAAAAPALVEAPAPAKTAPRSEPSKAPSPPPARPTTTRSTTKPPTGGGKDTIGF